jgi:hypothetical protein
MAFKDKMEGWGRSLAHQMEGRYGYDQLGMLLLGLSLVFLVAGFWWRPWGTILAWAFLIVQTVRLLSRNYDTRRRENAAFLRVVSGPASWIQRQRTHWANRKTKAYVRCPHCHAEFSLPKGKGKLRATCPQCGEKSVHSV